MSVNKIEPHLTFSNYIQRPCIMTKLITCLGQRNKFMKDDTKPRYTVSPVIFTHVTCTCTVQGTVSDCGELTTGGFIE